MVIQFLWKAFSLLCQRKELMNIRTKNHKTEDLALMLPIYDKYQLFDGSLITKKVRNELFLVYGIEERVFSFPKARCEATIHSLSNV